MSNAPLLALLALLIEAAVGYPTLLFRRAGHPVMWIGAGIAWLDRMLNHGRAQRAKGVVALLALCAVPAILAAAIQWAARHWLPGWASTAALALLASTLLAQRSLATHVRAVEHGLRTGLASGRAAVAHIVGRDPERLDGPAVARAAIESLAENFSDGVVAPALWCALLGLPGIVLYKAINTADSMIGHRTPRHERFGWAAARLDDLVNLPASRLAALLLVLAGGRPRATLKTVRRDAAGHRSPNAGWPEAAMAACLGLRLAGPRVYAGVMVPDAWMGDGRAEAGPEDIGRALAVYRRACILLAAVAAVAAALSAIGTG